MRSQVLLASAFLYLAIVVVRADSIAVSGPAIVREMNLARQNPALYASHVEEMRGHFNGTALVLPGKTMLRTREGVRALDEAVRFLQTARPQLPLAVSEGMSRAAADHCADQAGGKLGHSGSDWSSPAQRISRYGGWHGRWGENIAYGKRTARDIVLALIIDDGVRGRGHRKNIFNSTFNVAGAAYGPHATYGSVCSIEFAGSFSDARETTSVAQNL